MDGTAKVTYEPDDFLSAFPNQELVAVGQSNDCIRSGIDLFDKVGIEQEGFLIQTRELDHGFKSVRARRRPT